VTATPVCWPSARVSRIRVLRHDRVSALARVALFEGLRRSSGLGRMSDEHKTQWLSLEGERFYREAFMTCSGSRVPVLCGRFPAIWITEWVDALPSRPNFGADYASRRIAREWSDANSGARLRPACSKVLRRKKLSASWRPCASRKESTKFVSAAACSQNVLLVAAVEKNVGLNRVFVPPAPGNAGCRGGRSSVPATPDAIKLRVKLQHRCLLAGPAYSRHQIKDVLDNCKARFSFQIMKDRQAENARRASAGGKNYRPGFRAQPNLVRALLGNRRRARIALGALREENLNDFIKHRSGSVPLPSRFRKKMHRAFRVAHNFANRIEFAGAGFREGVDGLPEGFVLPADWSACIR